MSENAYEFPVRDLKGGEMLEEAAVRLGMPSEPTEVPDLSER